MTGALDGMVVMITGAARGIGAQIAHHAAQAGAEALVLVDRDPVALEVPCPVERITLDLAGSHAPHDAVAAALLAFGRIDGLVNAAGLTTRGGFEDANPTLWDNLFAINARAPFFLMSGVIAHLRARATLGSIVNIQSMNAHCGPPDLSVYAATKGALQTLTKNGANGCLADGIRVNGINLGWVDTLTERHLHAVTLNKGPDWLDQQARQRPLGRLVSEQDCARQAIWLLSPASAPMTGVSIDLEQTVVGAP